MHARVELKPGRVQPVWLGHPWIYTGAVARLHGGPQPGAVVEITDPHGKRLGYGTYNPHSQIAVRMLTYREEELDLSQPDALAAVVPLRIRQAAHRRERIGLPHEETNAFRLINSEGDRLPGLIVDIYAGCAVVLFTTLAMKQREAAVYEGLRTLPAPYRPHTIVEAASGRFAQQEGFASAFRCIEGHIQPQEKIVCREAGVLVEVSPQEGQKTGLFLDQRENRHQLGRFCHKARVLDMYSYTGGFALQALRHGATQATCVDSSARALEAAQRNAHHNGFSGLVTHQEDAFRFLEMATPQAYDVVVVDPPKFASSQKDLPAALKGYRKINSLAMNAVAKGGLFASSSCSQLVDPLLFERMLATAALDAGRQATLLSLSFQGPDHPILPAFPEGRYLKFALMSIE